MVDTSKSDVAICLAGQRLIKVRTENIFPPIPVRNFDWSAVTDNYEPGCPIGYGATEQEAIEDLQSLLEDSL